jgi:hypothetical protein
MSSRRLPRARHRPVALLAVVPLLVALVAPALPGPAVAARPDIPRSAALAYQPAPPIAASFLYLWQQSLDHDGAWRYWEDGTAGTLGPPFRWNSRYLPDLLPDVFDPGRELYSGQDAGAQRWVIDNLTRARMDAAISSWWGIGHRTDVALGRLMDAIEAPDSPNPLLRVAAYYEQEGFGDPSRTEIRRDLRHLLREYAARPSYLRIGGRPVLFVYGDDREGLDLTWRWKVARKLGFYTVLRVFGWGTWRLMPEQPDGWHDYRPAVRVTGTAQMTSVSPGFWSVNDGAPRLARDVRAFASASREALAFARRTRQPFVLWTTANEDGEGTGWFPVTPVTHAGDGSPEPAPGAPPSDQLVAILEAILPPLPRIVPDPGR